ncbi:MAG: thioredoxin family protein [Lentisphaerae bacterium]|nr:thioredoxin family protein [Lentisphaerota bacterium]
MSEPVAGEATGTAIPAGEPAGEPAANTAVPRLVDLGAGKCIPCKMMAPILADLKQTYAGRMEVTFIDVWEKPDEAKKYGINIIPTQIFYDAQGKELFRHEGFYGKEDIFAKWKEFGLDLAAAAESVPK